MKHFLTLLAGLLFAGVSQAQLFYNEGATVFVESGAVLVVEGGFENTAAGTIDNNGTIEVQGNFVNAGTWEDSDPNTIRFTGPDDADITSGGAQFHDVELDKGAAGTITLLDDMQVNNDFEFVGDENYVAIGAFNLIFGTDATITSADENEFVLTASTGAVRKLGLDASETFTFPVGFNTSSYNPVTLAATGGHTTDNFNVVANEEVLADGSSGDILTDEVVTASWDIDEDTPGDSEVDVTLGWTVPDEGTGFDRTNCAVSKHDGTDWDLLFSDLGASVANGSLWTRTRTGVNAFSVFAVGAKPLANNLNIGLTAFLQGPYSTGLDLMADGLRSLDLLPDEEPYTGLGYAHVGFGGGTIVDPTVFDQPANEDDIVDWVVVELRDANTPSTILATQEALIQRDGDIVDVDGSSSLKVKGASDGDYIVAVRHRNHLGIRTPNGSPLNLTSSLTSYDFTSALSQAFGTNPMSELETGVYGMWAGNANGNGNVRYSGPGNDNNTLLNTCLSGNKSGFIPNIYDRCDLNMNGNIRYSGPANDNNTLLNLVLGGNKSGFIGEQL